MPTGSAVVSDVVYAASNIVTSAPTNVSRMIVPDDGPQLVPIGELTMKYYLRLMVKDQPGVLAKIATVFAKHRISIESVIQKAVSQGDNVPLVIMTHEAREGDIQEAMKQFAKLDPVAGDVQLIRVEAV
jgi:homoserine dehydrogenase